MSASAAYMELVRELCEAVGITDWMEVVNRQSIAIGGKRVQIVPLEDGEPPQLRVCVDLGSTRGQPGGVVYERLLAANLRTGLALRGHYAVHPASKQAMYCMHFPLCDIHGAELARIIGTEVQLASTTAALGLGDNAAWSSSSPASIPSRSSSAHWQSIGTA